jgi:hypothetical protein
MEINNLSSSAGNRRESEEEKIQRLGSTLWNKAKEFFKLGRLLASTLSDAECAKYNVAPKSSIAHVLVTGQAYVLPATLTVTATDGSKRTLSVADGYRTLSLANCAAVWSCPACDSAHGTRVGVSRSSGKESKPNVAGLQSNHFLYCESDQSLFAFSSTCTEKYINGVPSVKRKVVNVPPAASTKAIKGTTPTPTVA